METIYNEYTDGYDILSNSFYALDEKKEFKIFTLSDLGGGREEDLYFRSKGVKPVEIVKSRKEAIAYLKANEKIFYGVLWQNSDGSIDDCIIRPSAGSAIKAAKAFSNDSRAVIAFYRHATDEELKELRSLYSDADLEEGFGYSTLLVDGNFITIWKGGNNIPQ